MKLVELTIPGVMKVEFNRSTDSRGFFERIYDEEIFRMYGLSIEWPQESIAFTKKRGTIRGLHFLYPPKNEAKFIVMLAGEAFWAFVDIRKRSPTLGKWGIITLSAERGEAIFIPRGFANGVCTLTDDVMVLYRIDNTYDDSAKSEFKWDDPELGISWPVKNPTELSLRDVRAKSFSEFLIQSGGGLELDN